MDTFRAKLITLLISSGLVASAGIGALLYYFFPQFYPAWYFQIVSFFLIFEVALVSYVVAQSMKVSSKKMVNVYMLTKVVKIVISLIFIGIYAIAVKENIKTFVLVFIVFYLLYLLAETIIFSKLEKYIKENNTAV